MKKFKTKTVAILLVVSMLMSTMTTATTADAKKKKTYVYYATHSKKYHSRKGCRTLARSKKIYKVTQSKAKAKHLTKCKVCY